MRKSLGGEKESKKEKNVGVKEKIIKENLKKKERRKNQKITLKKKKKKKEKNKI